MEDDDLALLIQIALPPPDPIVVAGGDDADDNEQDEELAALIPIAGRPTRNHECRSWQLLEHARGEREAKRLRVANEKNRRSSRRPRP